MALLRSPDGSWTEDVTSPVEIVNLKALGYSEVVDDSDDDSADFSATEPLGEPAPEASGAHESAVGTDTFAVVVTTDAAEHDDF